jgi:hypothetical protein
LDERAPLEGLAVVLPLPFERLPLEGREPFAGRALLEGRAPFEGRAPLAGRAPAGRESELVWRTGRLEAEA